ncbi:hypothetical protein [Oleomonas cavernae]|uniref:hypothetical protein n=1 Tax=Oleomonas cavernae TaxID=2320859 RepID=UPI0011C3A71F|nr:hypothetical protein [Oleomonas cavernae]
MVALKTERQIFMWRMQGHPLPKEASAEVDIHKIFEIIELAHQNGSAKMYFDNDHKIVMEQGDFSEVNCIYIADIKTNGRQGIKTILINRGDPDAANPAFIKPVSEDVRSVEPEDDEMQGWSAHLVISTNADSQGEFRACFEQMQNVSSTLVQKLLDSILDKYTQGNSDFLYEKVLRSRGKTRVELRPYKIRLSINRVPSEKIIEDIKKGELSEINLIKKKPQYTGPGAPDIMKSISEKLTIRTKRVDENRISNYIRNVMLWAKNNNYNEIQFKITDLPGKKSSSPRLMVDKIDAMETLYSRSQRITGFGLMLEACYSKVQLQIEKKMISVIESEERW